MSKITKLTSEQEALLPAYRNEWLKIGLSTEPCDRPAAEAAIDALYESAGIQPPALKIWMASPLSGAMAVAMLRDQVWDQVGAQVRDQVWDQVGAQVRDQVGDQVRDQVWAQVWAQVGAQVWAQVRAQVRDQVGDQVGAQVWDQVWAQVGAQVWDQVWAQVRDQVWAQVGDQVRDQVRDQVGDQVGAACFGAHDAGWLSFYSFFAGRCGVGQGIAPLARVARHLGWFWPLEGGAVLTERPTRCHLADGLLHCEAGPAIAYGDELKVYAWRGVRVPSHWIERRETLSAADVLKHHDVEQRAAGISILGMANLLDDLKHRVIDSDSDPLKGELLEVWVEGLPDSAYYLKFECPRNGRMMEAVNKRELAAPTLAAAKAWHANRVPAHLFNHAQQRS